MRKGFFICAACLLLPLSAHAGLIINEVAWMGTTLSATDEWIELFNNSGDAVPLSGWKLGAEDGDPMISLSGTVPAGGYYLLERTDDGSVPEVPADKIYTGNLANTGETLKLLDKDGVLIDTVLGGASWSGIGGDNTTKDTPQRQSDNTWITGVPTPKALNTTVSSVSTSSSATSTSSSKTGVVASKNVVSGGYKQVVFAYAGEDMKAISGAETLFEGYGVNDHNDRLSAVQYIWAFGDGAKEIGKVASHAYQEPGTYTVVLTIYSDDQKAKDKMLVTVDPQHVRVVGEKEGSRGYIEVKNEGDTEVDLSNWRLHVNYLRGKVQQKTFIIPESTIVAANTSVKFSTVVTGLVHAKEDEISLQYPNGARVIEVEDDNKTENVE